MTRDGKLLLRRMLTNGRDKASLLSTPKLIGKLIRSGHVYVAGRISRGGRCFITQYRMTDLGYKVAIRAINNAQDESKYGRWTKVGNKPHHRKTGFHRKVDRYGKFVYTDE